MKRSRLGTPHTTKRKVCKFNSRARLHKFNGHVYSIFAYRYALPFPFWSIEKVPNGTKYKCLQIRHSFIILPPTSLSLSVSLTMDKVAVEWLDCERHKRHITCSWYGTNYKTPSPNALDDLHARYNVEVGGRKLFSQSSPSDPLHSVHS